MAKYIIDIDALIECLDLVDSMNVNGNKAAYIQNIKMFISRFPKDPLDYDMSKLMSKGETE